MTNSRLRGASLRATDLQAAAIDDVDFTGANFTMALFGGMRITDSVLDRADFRGANLNGVAFDNCRMVRADLRGASVRNGDFSLRSVLTGIDAHGADFSWASLEAAELSGAMLENASFEGAYLVGACLHGASVHGARFHNSVGVAELDWSEVRGIPLGWVPKKPKTPQQELNSKQHWPRAADASNYLQTGRQAALHDGCVRIG